MYRNWADVSHNLFNLDSSGDRWLLNDYRINCMVDFKLINHHYYNRYYNYRLYQLPVSYRKYGVVHQAVGKHRFEILNLAKSCPIHLQLSWVTNAFVFWRWIAHVYFQCEETSSWHCWGNLLKVFSSNAVFSVAFSYSLHRCYLYVHCAIYFAMFLYLTAHTHGALRQ